MIRKCNFLLWLVDGALGILIVFQYTRQERQEPVKGGGMSTGSHQYSKVGGSESILSNSITPIKLRTLSPTDASTVDISYNLFPYISKWSSLARVRGEFSKETIEKLGGGSQSELIAAALNTAMHTMLAVEANAAAVHFNSVGEKVLTLDKSGDVVENIHNEFTKNLAVTMAPDTAEYWWVLAQNKVINNLRWSEFSITQHQDVSGEPQFIIRILDENGSESVSYDPENSEKIREHFGHLVGKFQN